MVRVRQWDILDLLDMREVLFGTTRDRVDQTTAQIGLVSESSWIEVDPIGWTGIGVT